MKSNNTASTRNSWEILCRFETLASDWHPTSSLQMLIMQT